MLFNKTFRLALCNWKTLVKSLLFQVVSLALFLSIAIFAFGGLAEEVLNAFQSNGVDDTIAHAVQSLLDGTFNVDHFLNEDLKNLALNIKTSIESVSNMWNRVEVSVIVCIVVFVLYRVLISFCDVTVGSQINEFMNSNAVRPFTWYFFKKMGRSFGFVFLQLLCALLFDTFIIAGSIALAVITMMIFGWWAIIPVFIVGVLLYALRLTLMAYCLPSVVYHDEKRVGVAFREGLSHVMHSFGKVFAHTIILVVVMMLTSGLAYLFNENRWLALSISAVVNFVLFFIIKCVNFVLYYESNNYSYFYKSICLEGTEKYNRKHKTK